LIPIPNFAFELQGPRRKQHPQRIIKMNGEPSIRSPELRTDWKVLRRKLGLQETIGDDNIANAYQQ